MRAEKEECTTGIQLILVTPLVVDEDAFVVVVFVAAMLTAEVAMSESSFGGIASDRRVGWITSTFWLG